MNRRRALALGALVAATLAVADRAHAHDPKPKHGGKIAVAGDYHVELVAKDSRIEVYVVDHDDKPVAVKGYKGVAILVIAGKSMRIPLEVADGTRLIGTVPSPLTSEPKGVVQINVPTGKTVQARFN